MKRIHSHSTLGNTNTTMTARVIVHEKEVPRNTSHVIQAASLTLTSPLATAERLLQSPGDACVTKSTYSTLSPLDAQTGGDQNLPKIRGDNYVLNDNSAKTEEKATQIDLLDFRAQRYCARLPLKLGRVPADTEYLLPSL